MAYLCEDCGNEESFDARQDYLERGYEYIVMDGEGDIQDYGDREANDSETTDGPYDIECAECDSGNVTWFDSEDELQERKAEIEDEQSQEENDKKTPTNWKAEILEK